MTPSFPTASVALQKTPQSWASQGSWSSTCWSYSTLGFLKCKRQPIHFKLLFESKINRKPMRLPVQPLVSGSRVSSIDLLLAEAELEGRERDYPHFADAETEAPLVSRQSRKSLGRRLPHPKSALRSCSKQVLGGLPQVVGPWVALQGTPPRCSQGPCAEGSQAGHPVLHRPAEPAP